MEGGCRVGDFPPLYYVVKEEHLLEPVLLEACPQLVTSQVRR